MNSNRKNDSILTKYNNLRDSIQQQKTVELLEKYNELADKLLKAQVDAEKPSIAIGTALFTDTIYKKLIPFDGHFYRMSINTFEYQNNGKRAAFNLKAKYQLFYPITKQKYTAGDYKTLSEVLLGTKNTYYFHPIIPIEDEKFYFAILTISWEDHLLGIRKDSTNLFMVLGKNSKNIIVKMQMDEERFKIMRNIEKVGKPINFPKEESEYIINEYFPSFYYK